MTSCLGEILGSPWERPPCPLVVDHDRLPADGNISVGVLVMILRRKRMISRDRDLLAATGTSVNSAEWGRYPRIVRVVEHRAAIECQV